MLLLSAVNGHAAVTVIDPAVQQAAAMYQAGKTEEAITALTLSAYTGSAAAQYNLAVIYSRMEENSQNRREMEFWLTRAAESGDFDAQFNLGMYLFQNKEDFGNLDNAVNWLEKAAQAGDPRAQYNLGFLSFGNVKIRITREAGINWLQRASAAGNNKAYVLLQQIQDEKLDSPPPLYRMDLQIKSDEIKRSYLANRDGVNVYAIPVDKQTPVTTLSAGAEVTVVSVRDGWLEIRLEQGFPAWVSETQVSVSNGKARVADNEASLFVEPGDIQQSFKVGLVDSSVEMPVSSYDSGWVQVVAPGYISLWVRAADIDEVLVQ